MLTSSWLPCRSTYASEMPLTPVNIPHHVAISANDDHHVIVVRPPACSTQHIFNTNDTHKEITNYSLPFPDPHVWQFKLWSVDDENFDRLNILATLIFLGFLESVPNAKSPSESSGWGLQKKQKTVSWSDDLQFSAFSFSWPPRKIFF